MQANDLDRPVKIWGAVKVILSRDGRDINGKYLFNQGYLPIFSVNDEKEGNDLLILACSRTVEGDFFVPALNREDRTLDDLYSFGDKLRELYPRVRKA